jgi:hypothetical protein
VNVGTREEWLTDRIELEEGEETDLGRGEDPEGWPRSHDEYD